MVNEPEENEPIPWLNCTDDASTTNEFDDSDNENSESDSSMSIASKLCTHCIEITMTNNELTFLARTTHIMWL